MHHFFDGQSEESRRHKLEQIVLQLRTDVLRLLKERDQRPREWYGLPPHAADAFSGTTPLIDQFVEGILDDDLDASTDDGETETTATLSVYSGSGGDWGDTDDDVTITNRDDGYCAKAGERLLALRIGGEYRPVIFPPVLRLGKTDAAHNKGATGTVSIYTGGSETDTGDNASSRNRFADLETAKWVITARVDGEEYLIAGECEEA